MSEYEQLDTPQSSHQLLPNAVPVLVLGILSLVTCCFYGLPGMICGIIALVLSKADMKRYQAAPGMYTVGSYNNLKAGRICAVIGVVLSALMFIYMLFIIINYGKFTTDYHDIFD